MSEQYPYDSQAGVVGDVPVTEGLLPPDDLIRGPYVRDVAPDGAPLGMNRVNNRHAFNRIWKFNPSAAARLRAATKRALGR